MSRSMLSNIPRNRSVNDDFQEISWQSRGSWSLRPEWLAEIKGKKAKKASLWFRTKLIK